MKKTLILLLLAAVASFAEVGDTHISRKSVRIYLKSGNWNTGDHYTTVPVIVDGKITCPYVGSIFADTTEYGTCPSVNVYHLVRVAQSRNWLDCYYDYTVGKDFMFAIYAQAECPDILAAYDGLEFFRKVYFDNVDRHTIYYRDSILAQSFEGDLDQFPRVKDQIKYRRIHMRKDKSRQIIRFGE